MNVTAEIIEGTLKPDGTLELDHKPSLLPGRVQVALQTAPVTTPRRGLADVIREIRADQIARGFHGLTPEQLRQREAEIEAENDEYDREMERLRALPPPASGAG